MQSPNNFISTKNKHATLSETNQEIAGILEILFPNSSISIYTLNPDNGRLDATFANNDLWPISQFQLNWIKRTSTLYPTTTNFLPIKNRIKHILTDFKQLKYDQEKFKYHCNDNLYLFLKNDLNQIQAIMVLHLWKEKKSIYKSFAKTDSKAKIALSYLKKISKELSTIYTTKKINTLKATKSKLFLELQEEKKRLQQRVLELTTLYEISSGLNKSLNYIDMLKQAADHIHKVLRYNCCAIFLNQIFSHNELFINLSHNFNTSIKNNLIASSVHTINLYFNENLTTKSTLKTIRTLSTESIQKTIPDTQSQATIPLIFQNKIIGIILLTAFKKNAFSEHQIQFAHTISNNISSNLSKLKLIRDLEKSKLHSIFENIREPVIILDEKHQAHIINQKAADLLLIKNRNSVSKEKLNQVLKKLALMNLIKQVKKSKIPILDESASYNNKNFAINISPIIDKTHGFAGVILLFRDVTYLQQMDRIKTQRLNAISKVNLLLKSIDNLDQLLKLVIDFLLKTTHCDMGSIQLKKNEDFITAAHKNFPEKIRRSYRFKTKQTISDSVKENKKFLLISNYYADTRIDQNAKILIELYICIPMIINNNLIGVINLTRKFGNQTSPLTKEDIDTLITISSLISTTIHNSILNNEKQENKKLDQEINLASEIHANLLPHSVPQKPKLQFSTLNIPARKIGGDFFDFIYLDKHRTGIIVADIVGKGIPAGLYMAVLKSIINRSIRTPLNPKKTLEKLNKVIFSDPVINSFVPLFYAIIDSKKETITYANAGHEPAYILRHETFIKLDTSGIPLGGHKNETFSEECIPLQDNDLFICFTDGVTEIKKTPLTRLGVKGIQKFMIKHRNYPPGTILDKFQTHIQTFPTTQSKRDDLTTIICRFSKQEKSISKLIEKKHFSIDTNLKKIKFIRQEIEKICTKLKYPSSVILDIQLAVNEAQANIIEHAYHGEPNHTIQFSFHLYNNKIIIYITDQGQTIQKEKIQEKRAPNIDELEGSGLGLFLIFTLMDEIKYSSNLNENTLKLVKYNLD